MTYSLVGAFCLVLVGQGCGIQDGGLGMETKEGERPSPADVEKGL